MPDDSSVALAAALKQLNELTARVEAMQKSQEGVLAKNSQLLAENAALKAGHPHKPAGKKAAEDTRSLMERDIDAWIQKARANLSGESAGPPMGEGLKRTEKELLLDRSVAQNAARYREARDKAEELGVPLRIIDDLNGGVDTAMGFDLRERRPTESATPLKLRMWDDKVNGVRFLRGDQVNGRIIRHRMAAEHDGLRLHVVNTVEDLDDNALAAYHEAGGE